MSVWGERLSDHGTYCCETLPGYHLYQSTLPSPSFHSSPKMAWNSASVRPGGRRRITTFSPLAGALVLVAFGESAEDWATAVVPFAFRDNNCGVDMVKLCGG